MTLPEQPAERHRRIGGWFTEKVEGTSVGGWDAATPVPDWTARDVVRHLTQWPASFLAAGSAVRLPSGPSVDDDPVAAWRTHTDAVQALLDDPATAELTLTNPHVGELPLDRAIDQFYTTDVFLHTWDLARATGQDETLDRDKCATCSKACSRWTRCCARAVSSGTRDSGRRRRRSD